MKSRLFVFQLREIIITSALIIIGIGLIIGLVFLLSGDDNNYSDSKQSSDATYKPGLYNSQIMIGNTTLNVEVALDSNHINSVSITNLNDSITTMYPLIEPSLDSINQQIQNGVDIEDIKLSENSQYTETLIIESIENAINKSIN